MNHYHELSISLHKATDDEMRLAISLLEAELHRRKLIESKSWILWYGGACPVSPETVVQAELPKGRDITGVAKDLDWSHLENSQSNIVAYRVVS